MTSVNHGHEYHGHHGHKLVLASESPRRRELLARLGVEFEVCAAAVDETRLDGETADDMVIRLATAKARAVFLRHNDARHGMRHNDAPKIAPKIAVLGGDTTVALGDEIFGKPRDRIEAAAMLKKLSGQTHIVHSAVALVADNHARHATSASEVTFGELNAAQIEQYCADGEPLDKAGGYGIQGAGGAFVKHINGSYSGVVGLPLWETARLLDGLANLNNS